MSQPDEIEQVFAMATVAGARVLNAADYGTAPGCAGDLVVLDTDTPAAAIANRADRRWVIKRGRVVAETTTDTTFRQTMLQS